jgi:hypothetical protein
MSRFNQRSTALVLPVLAVIAAILAFLWWRPLQRWALGIDELERRIEALERKTMKLGFPATKLSNYPSASVIHHAKIEYERVCWAVRYDVRKALGDSLTLGQLPWQAVALRVSLFLAGNRRPVASAPSQ